MSLIAFMPKRTKMAGAIIAGATIAIAATIMGAPATAEAREVCLSVHNVRALDRIDATPADFYVRVDINGHIHKTKHIRQQNEIAPNWEICQEVGKKGNVPIELELWDKDVAVDDLVDINPISTPKRHQNLGVNTRTCGVYGFSSGPQCGTKITQSGNEKKRATIVFSVAVK